MLSSHVIFLVLRQALETVIPLAGGPRFVLVHAVEDAEDGEEDGPDLAAQVDRVPGVVFWRVASRVCPSVAGVLAKLSAECGEGVGAENADLRCHDPTDSSEGHHIT